MESVFRRVKSGYEASASGCAGWYPDVLHGGAVAGFISHFCTSYPTSKPMRLARVTVDLFKPVIRNHLEVSVEVLRNSKNLQVLEAKLLRKGSLVAKASVLKIRENASIGLACHDSSDKLDFPDPVNVFKLTNPSMNEIRNFAKDAVEINRVEGMPFDEDGPGSLWIRPKLNLIEGESMHPGISAIVAADFGNAISSVFPLDSHIYINADLGVEFYRMPRGEWIGVESITHNTQDGVGLVQTKLYDREGLIGGAHQCLVMDTREHFFKGVN
ncbi:MAG TPA: thioesterase family protein [Gammaproteobacteria bacterium]|nr:thioesterase family protein [Gammaproteobacteria bacterium]